MKQFVMITLICFLNLYLIGIEQSLHKNDDEILDVNTYKSKADTPKEQITKKKISKKTASYAQPMFTPAYIQDREYIVHRYHNPKYIFQDISYHEFKRLGGKLENIPYQLPQNLLNKLSTEELILYCCDHHISYSPWQKILTKSRDGLETDNYESLSSFNGFSELTSRNDFFNEILNLMQECCTEQKNRNMGEKKYLISDEPYKNYHNLPELIGALFSFISSGTIYNTINEEDKIKATMLVKELYHTTGYPSSRTHYNFLSIYHADDSNIWLLFFSSPNIDLIDE